MTIAARTGTTVILFGLACAQALAQTVPQTYPARPVTMVVPFPPGGSSDTIGRIVATRLSERLGQPVLIENIGGAGGVIGTARVVRATADGHTVLLGSGSEILINKIINPKIAYDATQDLAPVAFVGTGPMVLVGHPSLPAATVTDLIRLAKSRPDALSFGSAGTGTPMHVAGELFKLQAHVSVLHVPYKGAPAAIADVLGGQVPLAVVTLITALPQIRAGKLRAYGLTTDAPSRAAPEIAPLAKTRELAGFDVGVWWGLFAPAQTPRPALDRLERDTLAVLALDDVRNRLDQQSITADGRPGTELARFMQAETIKVRKVVEAAGIKPE
jgi:tripartite-type tricarboxylate transporter receptor subunit TctC